VDELLDDAGHLEEAFLERVELFVKASSPSMLVRHPNLPVT
jgi:hypothetical protein